jgi:5-methyltetrahydropteroyltriglutamate--homocysteine methyltransferase
MGELNKAVQPFRAEHVGSLLRPQELLKARTEKQGDWSIPVTGTLTVEELKPLEDQCIRDAVAMQEEVGLQVITDGELRRRTWWQNFISALDGTTIKIAEQGAKFGDREGQKHVAPTPYTDGKIRRTESITGEDFKFVQSLTSRTAKVTLPSPPVLHFFGGRDAISKQVYPDLEEFWSDVMTAYSDEVEELASLGCTYLQLDETNLACLCDPKIQDQFRGRGEDPEETARKYGEVIEAAISKRPSSMTIGMHLCRGNSQGRWLAEGGYDYVADILFNQISVDTYFMEYDSPRAGDFSPLRLVPPGKMVVLGLISTKTAELEPVDDIKRRIDDAARFIPLEQLALSPQCGFASNYLGNPVSMDDQTRKLELVVKIAEQVWH